MRIYMRKEERKKLQSKYGCVSSVITESLAFQRHSLLSRQIRCDAMNMYKGIIFG